MKIRHKVNPNWTRPSEPITEGYQREIDESTAKLERRHRHAIAGLARAERMVADAEEIGSKKARNRALRVANELVELRREELQELHRMVVSIPVSLQHRGTDGYRHVPPSKPF